MSARPAAPPKGPCNSADYALTPEEWIERYAVKNGGAFSDADARHHLTLQLGSPWHSVQLAAPHCRAMFAVFALHLAEQRPEALALLGTLSQSLADLTDDKPEGPDKPLSFSAGVVAQVDDVLDRIEICGPAAMIANRHGYANTALMGLLNACRQKAGVLAPGQFAWLKLVDRPLWYALHSLGFETEGVGRYLHPNPRAEAAGERDHWAAERMRGRAIVHPEVEQALAALRKIHACKPKIDPPS